MYPEMARRQALAELLALPDSPDLRRGFRITVEGRPDRYDQLPYLASVFVQAKLLELRERDELRSESPVSERQPTVSIGPIARASKRTGASYPFSSDQRVMYPSKA
jgi:hypothetical protein